MICKYCKKEITDGSAFCNFCGKSLSDDNNTDISNAISNENVDLFTVTKNTVTKIKNSETVATIKEQGAIIAERTKETMDKTIDKVQQNNSNTQPNNTNPNAPLIKLNMISHYKGAKVIGVAESAGQLLVYEDRVEYKRQLGNSVAGAFGLAAFIVSSKKAKKQGVLMFAMDQIKEAREGAYAGVLTSIIIETKYGECHTFSNSINRSGMLKCIEEINKRVR